MSQQRNSGTVFLVSPVDSAPKPQVRGEACLVLLHPPGPDIGKRTPLARQSYIVGRDTEADLVISTTGATEPIVTATSTSLPLKSASPFDVCVVRS